MARGKQVYLDFTALVLLGYSTLTSAGSIWSVNIDNNPAPPPELGPPFSAHAIRDRAYLPYEILGIVGSYFIAVLILGTLLLSHAHRSRRRAQKLANECRGEEMVKPARSYWDPSPISPEGSQWYSKGLPKKRSTTVSIQSLNSIRSPGSESLTSFNASVIELDKQKRAQEMEKLYALVLAQEEQRAQGFPIRPPSPPDQSYAAPHFTDAPGLRHLQQDQTAPRSPVRAIYPSEAAFVQQTPHTSTESYSNTSPACSSGGSNRSPDNSPKKNKKRRSLRNLKISSPIYIPDNEDGARTPLTPRVYVDPGLPPEPPTSRTVDTYIDESPWPQTPGTARSVGFEHDHEYPVQEKDDRLPELPAAYSQREGKRRLNFSQPLKVEVPQQVSISAANASASSATNQLPFRQLHWNTPDSPMYPYKGQGPFSAGPTKTTFVEVRRDRLGGAPLTGLATPYSAYMPFTPLTPVTPHLTTRAERKQREREHRAFRGAITEEEQVKDDKDLWDSGY